MRFRGSGGHPRAYFSEKTPPKVKNGYETSWVEALVQSYGGFWPWSLRIHPPQHENAFRGVGVARGAPRGRISAKKHPQKSKPTFIALFG